MPTPPTAKWPKPRSEDEFEDMVVDFLRIRWQDPHATRHGRRGQRQDGVDIVGHPPRLNGESAGAQCKNTESITLAGVRAEVEKAKAFHGELGEFLIVTSAERDATLQREVREHFGSNPALFRVEVVFWPDMVADLSGHPDLVAKHWKGFPGVTAGDQPVPGPAWIDRDGVQDKERSECQCELAILPSASDIDPSELIVELTQLLRTEPFPEAFQRVVAATSFRELYRRPPRRTDQRYRWVAHSRIASNVIYKYELEVAEGGRLFSRWAEFTAEPMICLRTSLLVPGVLASIVLQKRAIEAAAHKLGLSDVQKTRIRLAAHASHAPVLLDDLQLTEPFLFSIAHSPADWSVVFDADRTLTPHAVGLRVLNRALANFVSPGTTVVRVKESALAELMGAR